MSAAHRSVKTGRGRLRYAENVVHGVERAENAELRAPRGLVGRQWALDAVVAGQRAAGPLHGDAAGRRAGVQSRLPAGSRGGRCKTLKRFMRRMGLRAVETGFPGPRGSRGMTCSPVVCGGSHVREAPFAPWPCRRQRTGPSWPAPGTGCRIRRKRACQGGERQSRTQYLGERRVRQGRERPRGGGAGPPGRAGGQTFTVRLRGGSGAGGVRRRCGRRRRTGRTGGSPTGSRSR